MLQADVGRASKILSEGFFKGKVNFLVYQWEKLTTYLILKANFPRPNALHQVFVACEGKTGRVLGTAEVDLRPTKRFNISKLDTNSMDPDLPIDQTFAAAIAAATNALNSDGPYMLNLAVDEAYQRQGIASALIQQCERQVQKWYVDRNNGRDKFPCSLYLKVRASNHAATKMYTKCGYMIFQQEQDENSGETIYLMRKELARPDHLKSTMKGDTVLFSNP